MQARFLLPVLLYLFMPCVSAAEYWAACPGCSASQARSLAGQTVPPAADWGEFSDTVYVLNRDAREVHQFSVLTINERDYAGRLVYVSTVDTQVKGSSLALWNALDLVAKLDVPAESAPSAIDYLTNGYWRGRTHFWAGGEGTGFWAAMAGAGFVANVNFNQFVAALGGAQMPLGLTLRFADGSSVRVLIQFARDAISGAPMVIGFDLVPEQAFDASGQPLPTSTAQFGGMDVVNPTSEYLTALTALADAYNVQVNTVCGAVIARFVCTRDGNCTLHATVARC